MDMHDLQRLGALGQPGKQDLEQSGGGAYMGYGEGKHTQQDWLVSVWLNWILPKIKTAQQGIWGVFNESPGLGGGKIPTAIGGKREPTLLERFMKSMHSKPQGAGEASAVVNPHGGGAQIQPVAIQPPVVAAAQAAGSGISGAVIGPMSDAPMVIAPPRPTSGSSRKYRD